MYDYQGAEDAHPEQEEDNNKSSSREILEEEGGLQPSLQSHDKLINSSNNKDNNNKMSPSAMAAAAAEQSTGRSRRKVRDMTGRYSLTHKGMLATQSPTAAKNSAIKTSTGRQYLIKLWLNCGLLTLFQCRNSLLERLTAENGSPPAMQVQIIHTEVLKSSIRIHLGCPSIMRRH